MSGRNDTPAEDARELPPSVVETAIKWLMYQHGMAEEDARSTIISPRPSGKRYLRRNEAIDVADFVETFDGIRGDGNLKGKVDQHEHE